MLSGNISTRVFFHRSNDTLKAAYGYYDPDDYSNVSKWQDIVEPITFHHINGWMEFGNNKSGFSISGNSSRTIVSLDLENLVCWPNDKISTNNFDLAIIQKGRPKLFTWVARDCYLWLLSVRSPHNYAAEIRVNGEMRHIEEP